MKIKHKVVKEFQYLSPDKKIFILKIGAILEEYIYKVKTELIPIDKAIIDNNPEFFEVIDWKAELLTFMRAEKMPQPAQLGKKLIPFFEDMIMSSIQHDNVPSMDPALMKNVERRESELNNFKRDLDRKETDLDSRDRRIKDKEDELEIRIKRVEKREEEYKLDVKSLEKKEDDLRLRTRTTTEKELDLQDKVQELNERERNIDRNALMSTKEIDSKYIELQNKIDLDLADLSSREKELESGFKKVKELESQLESNINQINEANRSKIYADLEAELKGIEVEIRDIDLLASRLSGLEASILVNHPIVAKIADDLVLSIKRLRERIDNNMIN
jgi:DNA repair exonuclease SbcCD ATPase subunit